MLRFSYMQIIGFAGRKGSGKDTCADFLVNELGFQKQAFAAPLKNFCQQLFLLTDDQLWGDKRDIIDTRYQLTPRQLLQKFGTDFIRDQVSPTFWVDRFADWCKQQSQSIVVSDVRFDNEVNIIKQLGGRVYRVERSPSCLSLDKHKSESAETLSNLHGVIRNDGSLSDLRAHVLSLD